MRVLILGYGQVGRVLASLLEQEQAIESIVCGDLALKEETKRGKISLRRVDLSNKAELSRVIEETKPTVVVNATLPKFNLAIMDSCLSNKVNYLDTASFWGVENNPATISPSYYKIEQLDYNDAFRKNGIVGLINAGVSPGLTNLLAKSSTNNLEEIDHIKIRLIEETKAKEAFFSWCKEWLIDEIYSKPLIYSGNNFELVENENEEEYDFPEPFGKKKVAHIAQDEVCTLPLYLKTKNVDIKAYDDQAELIKTKLRSKKPESEETPVDIRTFEEARFGFVIEASGKANGKNKTIKKFVAFPKQREINLMKIDANFITYPTALMMKAFTLAIPKIKDKGVFPPEALDAETIETITNDIKKHGINIWRTEISF